MFLVLLFENNDTIGALGTILLRAQRIFSAALMTSGATCHVVARIMMELGIEKK